MKQVRVKASMRIMGLLLGLFLSICAFAQNTGSLQGHVKDASGEAVIGATVRVTGQSNGVITDIDGNFTIKAKPGDKLQITFIGYKTQEVAAKQGVVVTLEDDSQVLDNVVVIGYGVAKKTDLTGSVTAMKPDSKNKGLVVNPQDMIQGKIAGVNIISNDGAPGSGAQIRVRGGSSLNASNDPLIVIDGLAMDNDGVKGLANPLAMVNPQDIESFSVLKDASATAIYGSRGSNGVIIITTKKGRKGQAPQVSYNGSLTVSNKRKTLDLLNGDEYRALIEKMYGTESDAYRALGTANTDWQDEIYRTAVSHDHNVTVSGATKNLPYRVSVGYTDQQGILKTSDFQRVTAALNLNPSFLNDHLTMNLNGKGMYAKSNFPNGDAISNAMRMDPTQSPYGYTSAYHKALLGNDLATMERAFGGFFEWTQSGSALNDPQWPYTLNNNAPKNPLAVLAYSGETAYSRSFVGSADVNYKVHGFEDLRLHLTLGADISKGRQARNISGASPNYIYYGSYGGEDVLKRNLSLSTYAQYYKDITKQHHFDIMAGYEWQHFWKSTQNDYVGYYADTNTEHPGEARPHTPYRQKVESYLVSFFGRANYSFADRYFLTATVRDDGTSRFKNHWAWFPSFAFAWKLKEEALLKNTDWLSDLKLRLGYGKTGQQAGDKIATYNWFPTYSTNTGTDSFYPVTGNGVLYRPDNYTPDLKWETTTTYNVGLDFGFCNQRLTGSVDYYYRKTNDLLNYAPTAAMSAYRNQAWQNIGSLKNTGVELALDWKAIQTKDLYWTISYNVTYNKNEITDLNGVSSSGSPVANTDVKVGDGTGAMFEYYQVGYPTNAFWVFQQVYDKNGNPIEGCVVDRDGDGSITDNDRYFYKKPSPDVTMGLSSRLEYKNWDLGVSFRASFGNYVFNGVEADNCNMSYGTVWSNSLNCLTNRLKSVVDRNWQSGENTAKLSDYYIQNASFLKCDNITLGYSFANLFKAGYWHGLSGRIYGTVSNVFTITKYKGIDPEINNGFDNNSYPRPISFIVGLNLNF